jgi:FlaA1/EpsC-like NDP-sugar epimerase
MGVAIIRFQDGVSWNLWRALGIEHWQAAVIFAMSWVAVLWFSGLYRLDVRWRVWTEARDIARATVVALALTLSTLFLFKQEDTSRLFLALLFVSQPTVTLLGRLLLRAAFEAYRRFLGAG